MVKAEKVDLFFRKAFTQCVNSPLTRNPILSDSYPHLSVSKTVYEFMDHPDREAASS
jgi:hypothetical protein